MQEEIEVEVDDEELDQVLDETHEFRTKNAKPRILAEDKIRKLAAAAAGLQAGSGSVSQESEVTNVKLPKLELPKVSGEVTQ